MAMTRLVLKDLPRYECLSEAAREFPDMDPSASDAFMHLIRASDDVWRVMNANFASHGITQGRFLIMMLLLEKKNSGCPRISTPAELADYAQVSRATISGLLNTLERDGFVNRQPSADDRRMVTVKLTEAGSQFIHRLLPNHFKLIASVMTGLTEAERKTLVHLLAKIINTISHDPISSVPAADRAHSEF